MDYGSFNARTSTRCPYARADTAALPYAEFINGNQHSNWYMSNGLRFIHCPYIN